MRSVVALMLLLSLLLAGCSEDNDLEGLNTIPPNVETKAESEAAPEPAEGNDPNTPRPRRFPVREVERYYTTETGVTCERDYDVPVQFAIAEYRIYVTVHYQCPTGNPLVLLFEPGSGRLDTPAEAVVDVIPPATDPASETTKGAPAQ